MGFGFGMVWEKCAEESQGFGIFGPGGGGARRTENRDHIWSMREFQNLKEPTRSPANDETPIAQSIA